MLKLSSYLHMFRDRSFALYASSAALSMISYGMSYIAMTWLVLQFHGGVTPVVILMFTFWLPTVFLSPLAGVIVDRYPRKQLFLFCSWSRGMLLVWLGLGEWYHPSLYFIYLISFFEGVIFTFVLPTVTSLVREIVEEKDLLQANSLVDVAYETGSVIGMALSGFAIALLTVTGSLVFDGLLFFVATIVAFGIQTPYKVVVETQQGLKAIWHEMRDGFFYIIDRADIRVAYTLELLALVSYMVVPVLTAPFATRLLHATVGEFGGLEATLSIGVVLGNFLVPKLVEKSNLFKVLLALNIMLAVSFAIFALNRDLVFAGALNFIIGIGFAMWPLTMTRAQELTALEFQGRVQSSFSALSGVVMLIVYGLLYFSNLFLDVSALYFMEVLIAIISIVLLLCYRRLYSGER